MTAATIKLAVCQYPIEPVPSLGHWQRKLTDWVAQATARGAQLLVFPEYASMELTAVLPAAQQADLAGQLDGLQALREAYLETYANLARTHGVAIVAGSFPERDPDGRYRNRAHVFAGDHHGVQAKLQMTRFEAEAWGIAPGDGQTVFELDGVRFGIAICYDSEFPLISRRLVEAGADLVLVPSCTDTRAGYHRVRVACQARALENQCYVVQAPTVGQAPWSLAVDANHGAAGIFAPPDVGLPDDGVVALGDYNQAAWLLQTLDLAAARSVRAHGHVFVHRDWGNPRHLDGTPPTDLKLSPC